MQTLLLLPHKRVELHFTAPVVGFLGVQHCSEKEFPITMILVCANIDKHVWEYTP